jgi:type II secretory pathway component PulJ
MEAEEQAELAAIEESERAELQLERDLALAASVNGREPPGLLSHEEFETVLEWHCGACHNQDLGNPAIDDTTPQFETVEELIEVGRLIPGAAASSRVVLRMQAGEMPPVRARRPPVQPAILELVVGFINSLPPLAPPED